jgi:hypothetical protein
MFPFVDRNSRGIKEFFHPEGFGSGLELDQICSHGWG